MLPQLFKRYYHSFIDIAAPVADALSANKAVVALETTIMTHGMPYPSNLRTAQAVEELVKQQKAVPATIGIVDGRIKVGLDEKSLNILASPATNCVKVSRRDFPIVLSRRMNGGTTVSGTLLISKLVGIDVFVTGGIGGVHRDVLETLDISADLFELSRSPVIVVSSGIKSILDIARTLEHLETLGVCVATYSDTTDFPAFYTRKSGYQSVYNVTNPADAADLIVAVKKLQLESGILLGVPIPEKYSLNEQQIQTAIENALKYCKEINITGKKITPFILDKVNEITGGKTLESNIALIKNNAVIGSKIAVEVKKKLAEVGGIFKRTFSTSSHRSNFIDSPKRVVVIGGSMLDIVVHPEDQLQFHGGTLNGSMKWTAGGVGRNIADALGKLQSNNPPIFVTAIGGDTVGEFLRKSIQHVEHAVIKTKTENSACCVVLLDNHRDCSVNVADMNIHRLITPEQITNRMDIFRDCGLIIFDGNLSLNTMECILKLAKKLNIPDHTIATKPLQIVGRQPHLQYCSPNLKELQKMVEFVTKIPCRDRTADNLNGILTESRNLALHLIRTIPNVMVTLGKYGLLMVTLKNEQQKPKVTFYKAIETNVIENVSGVGDCLTSGYIAAMLNGLSEPECVAVGVNSALQSLQSSYTVPSTLRYETASVQFVELPVTGEINLD